MMKLSKGFIYTGLGSLCWAITILFTKVVVKSGENIYNILFWTALLSLPYWIYVFSKQKNEFKKIGKKDYYILISIGLISGLLINLVEMFALKYTTAINYSFLIRMVVVFTIILAYFFFDEKINLKKIILVIMLICGAFLLTTKGNMISFSLGDILTIIEALLIAFGNTILGKIAIKSMSAELSSSASNIIGLTFLIIIAMIMRIIAIPQRFWMILLIALFIILGTRLRFTAYKHATATYITMIYSLTPVIVSLIAIPLLGESLTTVQIIGGALIILAGIFVEKLKI